MGSLCLCLRYKLLKRFPQSQRCSSYTIYMHLKHALFAHSLHFMYITFFLYYFLKINSLRLQKFNREFQWLSLSMVNTKSAMAFNLFQGNLCELHFVFQSPSFLELFWAYLWLCYHKPDWNSIHSQITFFKSHSLCCYFRWINI